MTETHLLAERTFSCVFIGVELVMYTTLLGFTVYMTKFCLKLFPDQVFSRGNGATSST